MRTKGILSRWLVTLFIFLYSTFVFADHLPIFLIVPLTPTVFSIGVNDTATVSYRVTNQTAITRTLTIKPIPGVTQTPGGAGVCPVPFTLARNQSCIMVLTINGSQIPSHIVGGPVVCKTKGPYDNSADNCLCAQPGVSNRLDVTLLDTAIISLSPSTISLVFGEAPVALRIFNNSRTTTALNVHAIIPPALGVTQDSSRCVSLAPRSSCTIFLTAGATATPTITVPVQGDNTNTITFRLKISPIRLRVLPQVLNFQRNTTGTITVHNLSTTTAATNIHVTIPAGSPIVVQSTTCPVSLDAGNSCTITLTSPADTNTTPVDVEADNSSVEVVFVKVSSVTITVAPNPLYFSNNQVGTLTVTNTSLTNSANNIGVTFHDGSPAIPFQNNCPSILLPGAICTIHFTSTTDVDTIADIAGSNTNLVSVPISVSNNVITASPNPLSFINKRQGIITVTNTSGGIATNITVTAIEPTSSPVTVVSNTCIPTLGAGATCTITLTSPVPYPQTTVTIEGTNTTAAMVSVAVPQVAYVPAAGSVYWCPFSGSSAFESCNSTVNGVVASGGAAVNSTNTFAYVPSNTTNTVLRCPIANDGSLPAASIGCSDSGAGAFGGPVTSIAINDTDTTAYLVNNNSVTVCPILANGSFNPPCTTYTNLNFSAAYGVALNHLVNIAYVANEGNQQVDYCTLNFAICTPLTITTPGDTSLLTGVTVSADNTVAYITLQGVNSGNSFLSTCGLNPDGSFTGTCIQQSLDIPPSLCAVSGPIALNFTGNAGYYACRGIQVINECPLNNTGITGACSEANDYLNNPPFAVAITH